MGKGNVRRPRAEYVVHFPHYDSDFFGPASTILEGKLKLIHAYETGSTRLYDIARDPGERDDLASKMPDKARELDSRLRDDLVAVGAEFPTPNPNFDPTRTPATKNDRRQCRADGPDQTPAPRRGGRGRKRDADDHP